MIRGGARAKQTLRMGSRGGIGGRTFLAEIFRGVRGLGLRVEGLGQERVE